MLEADRAEVGWESLEDWEFDNETLASKFAKLKKKQDGEVENSTPTHAAVDLAKEVAVAPWVSKAKRSKVIISPISDTRSSSRGAGALGESMLKKASISVAAKAGSCPPPPSPSSDFLAFSSTLNSIFWDWHIIAASSWDLALLLLQQSFL
jgi:hypothetical protein